MIFIGVTGGIGSGKSEACRIFQLLGGRVLDTDSIAKNLSDTDKAVKARIRHIAGADVYLPDGALNRKALAKKIFSDDNLLKRINEAVHPSVIQYIEREKEKIAKAGKVTLTFVESALVYESRIEKLFDYIIDIHANENTALQRTSLSKDEFLQRSKAQIAPEKKMVKADFVIHNDGSREEFESRCKFVYSILSRLDR